MKLIRHCVFVVVVAISYLFRWCEEIHVEVESISQDSFNWRKVFVLSKNEDSEERKFKDKLTQLEYDVVVCKDKSFTKQLSPTWSGSPNVNVQNCNTARCEFIVEANDTKVVFYMFVCQVTGCSLANISVSN